MSRIAILASGAGTTAETLILACKDGRLPTQVVLVIGNNSTADVFSRAARLGVTTRHLSGRTHPDPDQLDSAVLGGLHEAGATHIVLAGYMKKLGPRTLKSSAGRIFNTHRALLPAFGGQGMFGRHAHQAVLDSGAITTGATVHYVDADYDTGAIIAQIEVPVVRRTRSTVSKAASRKPNENF